MVGWLFRSTPKNSVNSLSLCTRVAFSTFSTRLTNFSYSFCNTNKKTSHEVRHRASATDNTTSHLYERPFLQELLAGGAGLWGGGEVDRGSPDSDSVPPAERHPEPRERSSLAQRVAGQRRAAVVRDVARQLAGRVVHGKKREHGVHGHNRWLQLRVRRGHEHIYRRELVGPSRNQKVWWEQKKKGRGVSAFRIHEQRRHVGGGCYLSGRRSGYVSNRTGFHLQFMLRSHRSVNHASQKSAASQQRQRGVVVLPGPPSREVARWARRARSRERTTRSASFHAVRRIGTLSCSVLALAMGTAAAPHASTEAAPRVVIIIFYADRVL